MNYILLGLSILNLFCSGLLGVEVIVNGTTIWAIIPNLVIAIVVYGLAIYAEP